MTRLHVILRALLLLGLGVLPGVAAPPADAQETELALAADGEMVDRVIAVVGDSVILQSQLQERMLQLQSQGIDIPDDPARRDQLRRELVSNLVDEQLIVQAALRDSLITVNESRVEEIVSQDVEQRIRAFGGEAGMRRALQAQGMTMQGFRNMLRTDARRQQLQNQFLQRRQQEASTIAISEDEMRSFFQENRQRLGQRPAAVTFEQIVLHPEAPDSALGVARGQAEEILARARAHPDSFPDLAREYSDDPGTREQGGDLGFFRRGQMVSEFEDAAFSLPEGRISDVVRSPFGFHVIKVERVRGAERRARHILIQPPVADTDADATRALAQDLADRLRRGASVDSLQAEHGDPDQPDSLTVPMDRLGDLPPGYESALQEASTGDVVGPLEWGPSQRLNVAVLRVEDVRDEGEFSFADVEPQIRQRLQQRRLLERLMKELRERTHVEIRLESTTGGS